MRPAPLAFTLLALAGCVRHAPSHVEGGVLGRVVVYRNGVAFYERHATVRDGQLTVRVPRERVDDFLKSLTVVDPRDPQAARRDHPSKGGRRRQLPDDDARDRGAGPDATCCSPT